MDEPIKKRRILARERIHREYADTHLSYHEAVKFIKDNLKSSFNDRTLKSLLTGREISSIRFESLCLIPKMELNDYCRSISLKMQNDFAMKENYNLFLKVSTKIHKRVKRLKTWM